MKLFAPRVAAVLFAFLLPVQTRAQEASVPEAAAASPIASALQASSPEVRVFNDHIVVLASPFMQGRLPGSRGMEIAKEYIEFHLRQAGLEPAFPPSEEAPARGESASSWRQPFPLSGRLELSSETLSVDGGPTLVSGTDFTAMSYGATGDATGELVFVGYSIRRGKDGYATYAEGDDLTGKIALMLRFEPMDEEGKSKWSTRGPWSMRSGYTSKLRAVERYHPAAVIVVNTPGADDESVDELVELRGGRSRLDVPVVNMASQAAAELVASVARDGPSLLELRKQADEQGGLVTLGGKVRVQVELERRQLYAENVGGVLRGRGALAEEYIVTGAHLDHIGMGEFGSRSSGELHPGADDNASGSVAVIMLADRLRKAYDDLPPDTDARSILFVCFSAEESGLVGSRHLANNPIVPSEQVTTMVNFDMIGRIVDGRLGVHGTQTGSGLKEWLQPYFEASPLTIVQPENMMGGSDHASFYQQKIPVLCGIIANFHGDYHTPRDVSSLINRVGAVRTIDLFEQILLGLATHPERFEFKEMPRRSRRTAGDRPRGDEGPQGRGGFRVRFGVRPEFGDESEPGVLVGSVTEGTPAHAAGLQEGDRIVKWKGEQIEDVRGWMELLSATESGDEVKLTVLREGKEVVLSVTLTAPARDGE